MLSKRARQPALDFGPVADPAQKTDWIKGPPTRIGWYDVSSPLGPEDEASASYWGRRWWNGEAWSWSTSVGDSDEYAATMQHRISTINPQEFYHRGLVKCPEEGYSYQPTFIPVRKL